MNKVDNKTKRYFTQIPNDLIRNSSISDRARFLYCYMSSMSEDWELYQGKMAKDLGYSKDTLRKYLDELISTGYLKRTQRRGDKGRFDSYDYLIDFIPSGESTVSEKTRNGKNPTREKSALKNNNLKEEQLIKNNDLEEEPFENPSEFSHFEKVTTDEKDTFSKVNPFTIVSLVEKEKEKTSGKKEKENEPSRAERKPNETFEAFTLFCQTFEQLSGAAYPTDKNGHYIMNGKEAGNMVYLMRWIKQVDRGDDWREALRVFLNAAWDLNDKWLRANFNPGILYGQAAKIFTAYQTSSPAAKDKAYNDRFEELLAERMAKYQD